MSRPTPTVDIDSLESALAGGATVIDVREPREYVAGHVPGAELLPMSQLPARVAELDRRTPLHVVCASGNRSAAMTDFLQQLGFTAYNVAGGTQAWTRSGRPVVTGLEPGRPGAHEAPAGPPESVAASAGGDRLPPSDGA